ncbi:MAG TPA: hypothetical protein VLB02_03015 [Candidatus Paceibacterota bacterium]|nr:hypothetical protein [Candidatus Paceibacterota bacterium]
MQIYQPVGNPISDIFSYKIEQRIPGWNKVPLPDTTKIASFCFSPCILVAVSKKIEGEVENE